jgi:hypothetical protein
MLHTRVVRNAVKIYVDDEKELGRNRIKAPDVFTIKIVK